MTACRYFALCDHDAVGTYPHPILGAVPTCQRCADRVGVTLDPLETDTMQTLTPTAAEIESWPRTPYADGQRASIAGEPRDCPDHLTGGCLDGGAGEWYAGYDDAGRGDYYR